MTAQHKISWIWRWIQTGERLPSLWGGFGGVGRGVRAGHRWSPLWQTGRWQAPGRRV